jgi:class 3 adenylate cyclase/tetratricopeptide (TPR) repeat protein
MILCAACGEKNPDRARFCVACGTPLDTRAGPRVEERRFVTVLFCELTGLTGRESLDPEELKGVLDRFHGVVRREVSGYGGTIDKVMGEAVLAVFGAPVAHEDDPERAIRAALGIRDAVAELAEADPDFAFGVRSGVNTGEAVVGRPGTGPQVGDALAGDAVNTAARLQQAATAGEVLVGATSQEAARFLFEFEPLEPVTVKGKSDPLAVWRAVASASRIGVGLRPRPDTPFVGRTEEFGMLQMVFRRAAVERSVQLVTITGEAGVGKSRLVEELARFVDEWPDLIRWRQGRSLPYGDGVGYWALGELVKAEAGILESDPPGVAEKKLSAAVERVVPEPSEREWVRLRIAPLAGLEDPALDVEREELFAAWRRFLEALAMDAPSVFVLEDVQWADEGMLRFVEHLVDWAVDLPMLIVCTARPELFERVPTWGGGRWNTTSIALGPLSARDTSMLLAALLDQPMLSREEHATLLERCGGNPLYAEEFARMVRDESSAGSFGDEKARLLVPPSLRLLIGARLDTLGPQERGVLQDAAVVGRIFWAGAVASLSDVPDDEAVRRLHEAVRREFVRPVRDSSMQGQAEYAFLHSLVQEVAYGQIPRPIRAAKHLAAAAWIGEAAGDRAFDVAEVIAHHAVEALELTRSGAGDLKLDELESIAGRALLMAGDRAKRLDPTRALSFYLRAREVLPAADPERIRALVEAAEAAEDAARFEEATIHFEGAIAEARAMGHDLALGEAMARMARSVLIHGPGARELLEEAIEILERHDPGSELARAYARMAGHLYVSGDDAGSIGWAEKAFALADRLGVQAEAVLALQYRGAARAHLGDRSGLTDLREALRRAIELGLGNETAIAYNNLAYELWFWEGPEAAQAVWDEMNAFCRVRGFQTLAMWSYGGALESLFDLGEWDRVLRMVDEMLAWDRQHGPTRLSVTALTYRGWVQLRRGYAEEVAATLAELLPLAQEIGYADYLAPALTLASEDALSQGDPAGAVGHIRRFVEVTRGSEEYRSMFLPVVLRVLVAAGAVEEAEELLGGAGEPTSLRHRLSILSARAVVAEATGEAAEALELYVEATEGWRGYGFALERARALLGQARSLLALDRGPEALPLLETARSLVAQLGARPLVEEIDSVSEQAHRRAP